GDLTRPQVERLMAELLVDPLAESGQVTELTSTGNAPSSSAVTVLLKPGVMDPVALSVIDAAHDLGLAVEDVRTFRRYYFERWSPEDRAWEKVLANDAIEQLVVGPLAPAHLALGTPYIFHLVHVPLRHLEDAALEQLSRQGQLSLNLSEMRAIQAHFR